MKWPAIIEKTAAIAAHSDQSTAASCGNGGLCSRASCRVLLLTRETSVVVDVALAIFRKGGSPSWTFSTIQGAVSTARRAAPKWSVPGLDRGPSYHRGGILATISKWPDS
eukprot:scaffold429_cov169-Amphora_coffeaeformis.AAC.10